ncbi:DNA primase [Cytophagaceae bacterium DM2B3-1]|uniref:DNA primase n=1 Tax=Xanthocytophaga flava TaxID=3048013 RepID=A0ABT7CI84_9BACT|nr:DNA primase [Xanthocytophaga flavus]MDJ1492772.1 DNA primase [Xanthocytophaga flavus]
MRIPNELVQQIQQAADVLDVVGDYVSLKKRGSNWIACCPFHNEKTPSFAVSPAKGIYKCFGCGKSGDPVKFVMDIEGVSFAEALRHLARKYNIEIPEVEYTPEETQRQNEIDSLYIALNFAKDFFKQQLQTPDGQAIGLSYFKERDLRDGTIDAFDLGYSSSAWDAFTKEALSKHYNLDILQKAGLTIVNDKGRQYDRFRDRVIFPIHNLSGRVIAFGARIMTNDKNQPKYLNSPETEVYHKSRILYGIYQAKNAIRQVDNCYLAEGYMDVISLHQAGIQNVVASSGTSLTKEQIQLISRFTKNVTMLYDGDAAGIKASIRGTDLLLEEGLNVKIVIFPDNDDPDSYVRKVGSVAFQEFVKNNSQDFITFKVKLYSKEIKDDPYRKSEVIKEMVASNIKIPDPIQRSVFRRQIAHLLDVDEQTLITEENFLIKKERVDYQKRTEKQQTPPPDSYPPESYYSFEDQLPEGVSFAPEETYAVEVGNKVTDHSRSSMSYREEGVIRLILHYGDQVLEGTEDTVCDFVMRELEDIAFQTPIYQQVLDIFRSEWMNGRILKSEDFLRHPDPQIQDMTITMLTEKYTISDNWFNKFDIRVAHESDNLLEETYNQVLRLKQEVVRDKIAENFKAIQATKDINQQLQLLRVQKQYKEIERQIANILGNVIR